MKKLMIILLYCSMFYYFYGSVYGSSNNGIENLNNITDENKWRLLKENILRIKIFSMPPDQEYHFSKNNDVYLIENNINSIKKHKGIWEVNEKAGYFIMKMNWEKVGEKFYSFYIDCRKSGSKRFCQIVFYKGKIFKTPQDKTEIISSEEYFILAPIHE